MDIKTNNPENSSTKNVGEQIPSDFSVFIISLFTSVRMNDVNRGKECMKKFCKSLRGHKMEIINFENKKDKVINKRAAGII